MADKVFTSLAETDGYEAAVTRSQDGPVVLFLHDYSCPISRAAYGEMQRLSPEIIGETRLVDVGREHALKRQIEAATGVRHESPQAIILRDGKAVWDASHFAITARGVAAAFAQRG
jgi:bacillithiol system protein YtxJ